MKKSFQLSAVAIAIAASSSVMAATVAQTGASFVTSASVNGINVNGTLTGPAIPGTSKTDNPFNVQFTGAVTINPGDSDSAILTSIFGSQPVPAGAAVTHNADGTKTITYQVANNTIQTDTSNVNTSTQIINDQKVELSNGISTTKTQRDFSGQTVTLKYTPNGVGNNFVGSNPVPVAPVVTNLPSTPLSVDSITVGKKVAGADNALTVTKKDSITGVITESVVKASGISTTGTLNVAGDTTVSKLIAGDTTVAKLTAGDTTLGKTTTGELSAGDTTVSKLTAGDTTVAKLTAGASTLDSLTVNQNATVTGTLTAGDTTVAKLTAGASILDSLNVTKAATVNGFFTVKNDADVTGKLTAGSVKTSLVDLGTTSSIVTTNTAPSANRLTARYDVNGTTIYETQSNGVSTYYTITAGVATEYTDTTVIAALGKTVAPTAGGTTQTQSVLNTTTATVKEVTDKAVTYGEIKTQQDAVTVNGTLNNGEAINVNVGTGTPVDINNQSVSTGIVDSTGGVNTYGTVAKSKVTAADGTVTSDKNTTLTANGIVVKDTVSGKSTTVNANGITTDEIIVDGTNVKTTLDQHSSDIAKNTSDIAKNTSDIAKNTSDIAKNTSDIAKNTSDITALDTRVTNVAAAANAYTDGKVEVEKTAREAADTAIRTDFAAADAATLTSANGYTDTKAAATLTSANGYTDTKSAATLASANAYTDGRANQLNTRIDDVQRTAYRGIAISLAAQQAVPSIQPGQVAIFGGVGHYEGETAGSVGVVTAFTDRLSASGAFGFAGGNEFGGRVGVAYVFGGK